MSAPRLLVIASAVGPFGTAETGGVSRFAASTCAALRRLGVAVDLVCPAGSAAAGATADLAALGVEVLEVGGTAQPTAAAVVPPETWPVVPDPVLGNMLGLARERQWRYAAMLNLNHDWLSVYLTPFFGRPLLHVPNLTAADSATDAMVRRLAAEAPSSLAFVSRFQAGRFGVVAPRLVPPALDPADYRLGDGAGGYLAWAGRIAPEKGLHHAADIAAAAGRDLHVAGGVGDESYWREVRERYGTRIRHRGFLDRDGLQAFLGDARVLLQTQDWEEAFGIVTVESLLVGTPVVAYDRGANAEVLAGGDAGLVIDAEGGQDAAVAAIRAAEALDRAACRETAVRRYSLDAMTAAYRDWLGSVGVVL